MSCTIASSEEPSVMTCAARSRWRNTANMRASLGRLPEGGYFVSRAARSAVRSPGRYGLCPKRSGNCVQCRFDFAEHGDIAGIVKAKLTCSRRDLYHLQFTRHCRTAIISERIDLFADQQHRVVAAQGLVDFFCGRRKLTAKVWVQRVDRALYVEWRSVDICLRVVAMRLTASRPCAAPTA